MVKLSSTQVKSLMKEASETLKKLASDNIKLEEKLAFYQRKERCEKIADLMSERGVKSELSREEKVAELMGSNKNLDVIEEAVLLDSDQIKIASLSDKTASGADPFMNLISFLS